MKINGNTIRPGNVIEHKNSLWVAVKTDHTKPGKGGAYLQVELKNLLNGTKLNERFRANESVERVRLDEKPHQYLFSSGEDFTFMDNETYEQVTVPGDFLGDSVDFLQEGMTVTVCSHEGKPITIELPENIVMEVTEADPVVKGQTASSSYKPAVLENGRRILVPPHIEAGTKVVVSSSDGAYVEKHK